jgi:hypothetical protein
VDTCANLTPGPETRYYVGQFLRREALAGELSDVLVVTVPGVALDTFGGERILPFRRRLVGCSQYPLDCAAER